MTNCLVTGGAGFIGSHLVERLLNLGHDVTVLDNLSTGRASNLASLKDRSCLTVQDCDVAHDSRLPELFEGAEWVFHLAGLADIVPSVQNPTAYHDVNVSGTVAVLEASRAADVKRFVYTASSSCYGIPDNFPTTETDEIRAMYPYALTKYLGEQYTLHWNKVYHLPSVSLRLFNVYGPRSRTTGAYGAVFGVLLAQKLAGQPLTIVGDGSQTRDFTYVTDVADAFIAAADSEVEGEVFNVGSGNTYSISHLAGLIGGDVTHIPKRPGEPDCTFADTRKIFNTLDWSPKVSFEDGVQRMLANIEYWKDAPVWDSDSISEATEDWFKYLGDQPKSTSVRQ